MSTCLGVLPVSYDPFPPILPASEEGSDGAQGPIHERRAVQTLGGGDEQGPGFAKKRVSELFSRDGRLEEGVAEWELRVSGFAIRTGSPSLRPPCFLPATCSVAVPF